MQMFLSQDITSTLKMIELYPHQIEAISKMKNGCILCGDVGTGKSRTAIAYYYEKVCDGRYPQPNKDFWGIFGSPRDLLIITTAKKRDSGEWLDELAIFQLFTDPSCNPCNVKVTIDSWNNIGKYKNIQNAFVIFDEQRIVGYGSWVKSFLKISNRNQWILLTATPGDVWSDYIPVFIANHFYRNKSEFALRHIVYDRFAKYPKISYYIDVKELVKHRNDILIKMDFKRSTQRIRLNTMCEYNKELYSKVVKDRWDPYDNKPIEETGKLCYLMRKVVNDDHSRVNKVCTLLSKHPRVIIFYNFTYELEALREMLDSIGYLYSEWNGEKHAPLPKGEAWVYLVQYAAGAEGWNCVETNTIIFYSLNYSYRMTMQAEGRIDRLNTTYKELYFYYLKSSAPIDKAISNALHNKQNFNERTFLGL